MKRLLRAFLLSLFRQVMRIYFRKIEILGAPGPATKRRMFGANHVNGLIDPLLVMTSTRCHIAPMAKATLWNIPGLNFLLQVAEAVPVVRRKDDPTKVEGSNEELFAKAAEHLGKGANILIFPEGVSHNEPHLVRLRSGAARMLASAREQGVRGLTYQAVGLEFDERETFRSRALVLFGPVRSVDDHAGEPDLAAAITQQMSIDLPELIVEGSTWEDRLLIARVAELLAHESGDTSLAGWNSIGRRVEAARKALRPEHAELHAEVERAVGAYYTGLAAARLTDEQLVAGQGDEGQRAARWLGLFALFPVALAGAVLYFIPYQIPKLSWRIARDEGDVVSTYKLGLGLVSFPAWAALLVLAALVLVPLPFKLPAAALALASPFAALPWLDVLDQMQGEDGAPAGPPPDEARLHALRREALDAINRAREVLVG